MGTRECTFSASELGEPVQSALRELRKAGWYISEIRWEDRAQGTVEFIAKKDDYRALAVCFQSDLAERLRALLGS